MKSAVAGILDKGGGFRVVITKRSLMHLHVGEGERLFIIPGLKVKEPVEDNNQIAYLVDRVAKYIAKHR